MQRFRRSGARRSHRAGTAAKPVCRDPDDDEVLALALAAQVELIVSGDDDLLDLNTFEGIAIVTPGEALRRVEALR